MMEGSAKIYNLEQRTAVFAEAVVRMVMRLPKNSINNRLIDQLVGAATGVGSNYREANGAESLKDFRHKLAIARKEARESKHFFHMIAIANPTIVEECRTLWREADEITRIFSKSIQTCDKKLKKD